MRANYAQNYSVAAPAAGRSLFPRRGFLSFFTVRGARTMGANFSSNSAAGTSVTLPDGH
jgi:hypothetical protein